MHQFSIKYLIAKIIYILYQINIIDCNNEEILEFAKKNDIELLTHRDPTGNISISKKITS